MAGWGVVVEDAMVVRGGADGWVRACVAARPPHPSPPHPLTHTHAAPRAAPRAPSPSMPEAVLVSGTVPSSAFTASSPPGMSLALAEPSGK